MKKLAALPSKVITDLWIGVRFQGFYENHNSLLIMVFIKVFSSQSIDLNGR